MSHETLSFESSIYVASSLIDNLHNYFPIAVKLDILA